MLTIIAKEISAGNFDYKKDIVEIDKNDLNDIKDLYDFIIIYSKILLLDI